MLPKIGPARCSCGADLEPGAFACRACGLLVTGRKKAVRGVREARIAPLLLGAASGLTSMAPLALAAGLYVIDTPETATRALGALWVCLPIAALLSGLAVLASRKGWMLAPAALAPTRPASLDELLLPSACENATAPKPFKMGKRSRD